ncbi:binding-protein-dependent transport systems inner membrane component [Beutenbergia cavernae DSM 12333]|uniref:Binding-protein-dependent transport systems inner membrane component n=1 Tax=Beutenbergia cavernae (strain ATCC BAA-8 / DSM 12333 / CCUG 43141 / JCM 11478 / NBRC 16432 / NCIMB 13614 / HKI 0122) TaxID=471853 RepID=C5C312_BEUC1|nr:sugar ABC transporter permease [Beutenbergia cavernae]ACQ81856.1 binding-protein-dependent transport systems inner membrane component [Beutenbergia cavernae DSM 12333]
MVRIRHQYSYWFAAPGIALYLFFFVVPSLTSFFFSLTRWSLTEWTFIGLDNFRAFLDEPFLSKAIANTFVYALATMVPKVLIGLPLAAFLVSGFRAAGFVRSVIFFPTLVSTVGIGITFRVLMNPTYGLIDQALGAVGIRGPEWLSDPDLALLSVAAVDVWSGIGIATLIFVSGVVSIPQQYFEAATVDGAGALRRFFAITVPLTRPATATVVILALIGGLRAFDLIWVMTGGGPGFASDVLGSVIFKQYTAGFYGLSTAGNVIMFVIVAAIAYPVSRLLTRREVDL